MSIYLTYMIGWVRWFPLESRKTGNLTKNKKERPKLPPPMTPWVATRDAGPRTVTCDTLEVALRVGEQLGTRVACGEDSRGVPKGLRGLPEAEPANPSLQSPARRGSGAGCRQPALPR